MTPVIEMTSLSKWSDLLTKSAGDSFEDTFANIAHSYLQEKAIKLIDYLVGFEVVDKNDENTKAVGLFAFKVGDKYLYAPVFFINGQIKPLELLYIKDEDLFVPLDEEWITYLLKQAPVELGQPSQDHKAIRFSRPDLQYLVTPPRTGRYISASLRKSIIPDWLAKFEWPVKKAFVEALKEDPKFKMAISRYTDMREIVDAIGNPSPFDKSAATKITRQGVVVVDPDNINDVSLLKKIPEGDQEKIRSGKTVVYDSRPDNELSDLYTYQYIRKFQNPQKSGVYKVIDDSGSLINALVLITPKSWSRLYASEGAVVVELDSGRWTTALTGDIWVRENVSVDDWSPLLDKIKDRESGVIGSTYVFLDPKLHSSAPFTIMQKIKDSSGILSYKVDPAEYRFPEPQRFSNVDRKQLDTGETNTEDVTYFTAINRRRLGNQSSETSATDITPTAVMSPNMEGRLFHLGHGVAVPGNFGLLKLQTVTSPADILRLGNSGDVQWHLCNEGVGKLTVHSDGNEYSASLNDVPGFSMSKRAMIEKLANDFRLKGADALTVVDSVTRWEPKSYFIKFAQNFYPGQAQANNYEYKGPTEGPVIPNPSFGAYGGLAPYVQNSDEQLLPIPTPQYPAPSDPYNPATNSYTGPAPGYPAQMDTSLALQAAGTGQQRVFDHGVIGTLAKATQTSDLISSYVPELQTSVDRLGRILFMMWWKPEDFKDLYGVSEMAEAEDKIRNVFSNFGEILLTLKSKESTRLAELS